MSEDQDQSSAPKERIEGATAEHASGPGAIDFATFVSSLASAAFMYLGEFDNPETGARDPNLDYARHHIDIIQMLHDKTVGNLSADETRLVEAFLAELQMKYVEACS
jgi:hypothetical protein